MTATVIRWTKSYCEDLGNQDEQGFYDYAYLYLLYGFQVPSGSRIIIRRYTDEPGRGILYFYDKEQAHNAEAFLTQKAPFVAAVVAFMRGSERVTSFDYFSGTYQPLPPDLSGLPGLIEFIFESVSAGE